MIVLDTHVLIWYLDNPSLLSTAARRAIDAAIQAQAIFYSQISLWEIAMLAHRGRIQFKIEPEQWLQNLQKLPLFTPVGITAEIASHSVRLPDPFPGDPADRIIAATSLHLNFPLVTRDEAIRKSTLVRTIW